MAMEPERSKPLHNFSMPYLTWGSQRFLKCINLPSNSNNSNPTNFTNLPSPMNHVTHQPSNRNSHRTSSIEESKKPKFSIVGEAGGDESAAARPWNLRTRRAACKGPEDERNLELGSSKNIKEKNRSALIVSLSKEEIEEDFGVLVGRLPRRPKKRPRAVQKQLDTLFPGLFLTQITPDSYKLAD
ncbi:hypothetical protein SDJN02_15346, partial [Cucurbita argyrosperma subsp. argyrosperma]